MYLNDPLLGPRIFDVSIEPLNTAFPKIDKILKKKIIFLIYLIKLQRGCSGYTSTCVLCIKVNVSKRFHANRKRTRTTL